MIHYQLTNTKKELEEILDLQQRNLPQNLTVKEQREQGFLTVEHNFNVLKKLNNVHKHIIAKYNNKVIGYALSMDISCKEDIEILKPMFQKIDAIYTNNYIVMGQICIDKQHRSKGVFNELYTFMKVHFSNQYSAIITEIDAKNTRSIKAHKKVGFTELTRYFLESQEWIIVILKC